jgi:hypothetical protein
MQQRNGARELGLVVATLGVLVHFVDPVPAAVATALIVIAAAVGMGAILGQSRPWRMPVIPLVLPALAAFSIAGVARIVGPVPWLGLVFVAGWAAMAWVVSLESIPPVSDAAEVADASPISESEREIAAIAGLYGRTAAKPARPFGIGNPSTRMRARRRAEFDLPRIVAEPLDLGPETPPHPRPVAVRTTALGLAFVAFAAIGGIVPGGLSFDGSAPGMRALVVTVAMDLLVGGLVGYRIASIAATSRFDRVVRVLAIGQYAVPVGLAGAALRYLAFPRLFGPALLTLAVYVITVVRESPDPVRTNSGLLREMAVLGLAGALVVAWGFLVR